MILLFYAEINVSKGSNDETLLTLYETLIFSVNSSNYDHPKCFWKIISCIVISFFFRQMRLIL
jgi:hypothetical protein